MHYVKHFNINGVNVRQVACIELSGPPNAATEGAVGALGMDMTSPTHEVYRCVAVNGSVYTWELLSGGVVETWKKVTEPITDYTWLYQNRPSEVMLSFMCGNSSMENYRIWTTHFVKTAETDTVVTYEGDVCVRFDYDSYHNIKYSGHLTLEFSDGDFEMTFDGMKDYMIGYEDGNCDNWVDELYGESAYWHWYAMDFDNYIEFNISAYKGV